MHRTACPSNYTSSNSGTGRYEFTNQTIDYAVSDIGYVGNTDTDPAQFPVQLPPHHGRRHRVHVQRPGSEPSAPAQQPHRRVAC